ncbi:hypothetical protein N7G274_000576 [Stereocaulon virgatum]|uniref:Uncharacterized protein n=1 Tax=Stereocaulon virgatum TaxID=373712 RepID=A0ABR4AVJ7_9LECA
MVRFANAHVFLIFGIVTTAQSIPNIGGLDYSNCAQLANATYLKAPNSSFLYDQRGKPTGDASQAWGISYQACIDLCTAEETSGLYNWGFLASSIASWLLPWLALNAQLPFATKDKSTNLMALLLAMGSPALITYSLALTILNAQQINRTFRYIKEININLNRHLQLKAIKAARTILIETQHIPIQIYSGPRRELAQLVVHPQNWRWWCSLRDTIFLRKRKWTYSLYAQVGFVCVSQVLAITIFFTSASSDSSIGIGLAINSLWLWMIPVVLGWVYVGMQTEAGSIKAALIDTKVPVLGSERDKSGDCIGIRDRTSLDDFGTIFPNYLDTHQNLSIERPQQPQDTRSKIITLNPNKIYTQDEISKERLDSVSSQATKMLQPLPTSSVDHLNMLPTSQSDDIEISDLSGDTPTSKRSILTPTLQATEERSQLLLDLEEVPRSYRKTFLGFSIAGDDLQPGPIFNYARVESHMNAVRHVAEAFLTFTMRQKAQVPLVASKQWRSDQDHWDENIQGTPEEMSTYISPSSKDMPNLTIHAPASPKLVLNCIAAAFVATLLQWGTTGAAIIIGYKTPVVGLGCQSGSYLIYGSTSTVSWLTLVLSAYLSHRWSLLQETAHHRSTTSHPPPHTLLASLAVTTRLLGKLLAAANAAFVVATSAIIFTGLYDNCWCAASIPSLGKEKGWVILFASGAQIITVTKSAWVGGVLMAIVCAVVVSAWVFVARGDEVFEVGGGE